MNYKKEDLNKWFVIVITLIALVLIPLIETVFISLTFKLFFNFNLTEPMKFIAFMISFVLANLKNKKYV